MKRPLQIRSQKTTHRILEAVMELLCERGLDEISVSEIAGRAGVSIGGFYARFTNKEDAVAWLCDEEFLARFVAEAEESFAPEQWTAANIEQILAAFHGSAVAMFRQNRALLREVARLSRTSGDRDFRQRIGRFNRDIHRVVRTVLLAHTGEIGHPDPSVAIDLGMIMVSALMREVIFFGDLRADLQPVPDAQFAAELTRIFCGYLALRPKSGPRRSKKLSQKRRRSKSMPVHP